MKYIAARKWLIGSIFAAIISLSFQCNSLYFAKEGMIGTAVSLSNQASEKIDRSDSLQRQAHLDAKHSDFWHVFGLSFFVTAIVLFVPSMIKRETQRRELPIAFLTAVGIFQLLLI